MLKIKMIVKIEKKEHYENCRYFGNFNTDAIAKVACDCGVTDHNRGQEDYGNKSVGLDEKKMQEIMITALVKIPIDIGEEIAIRVKDIIKALKDNEDKIIVEVKG